MRAVRYLTLMALVVWLGGLVTLPLLGAPPGTVFPQFEIVEYACGGLILVGLLVLKFVGPPPPGFIPRMALVSLMLAVALSSAVLHVVPATAKVVEIVCGLALLSWYVRE